MFRCFWALTAILIVARMPALGQENKDEVIQKLISRVESLEREVAAMKQAAAPEQSVATLKQESVPATVETTSSTSDAAPASESRFTFHGYADAGFLRNQGGDSAKRFVLGEVDLFATARISTKLTALMETVLETDNQVQVGNVPVNVERLLLQYRYNDYFNLDIGSYRTAIGFYSTAYLRGSWLQTALTRPKLFVFEDEGGFLPLHNVGLSANGRVPSGGLGLHYVVEVGSSRNYAQPGRTGLDFEQNGAINVALYARPQSIPGLQGGFSYYHDRFSPLPGYLLNRSVWTAHAVYQANRMEFLNEGVLANYRQQALGYGTVAGFYSQIAYHAASNWSPYVRYDYVNVFGRGSVGAYAPQYVPWRTATSGGVRYDLTDSMALKFEVGRELDRFKAPWISAALQVAFTF